MKVYAAIHTAEPKSQSDHEASYLGYERIEIDLKIGEPLIRTEFPEVQESTDQVATWISMGSDYAGEGSIFMALPMLPHIPLVKMNPGKYPHICMAYPDGFSDFLRVTHQLIVMGKMRPEDMHPKYFEYVNEQFQAVGIPILKVTRGGAAKWDVKMSNMPSLNNWTGDGQSN